MYVIDASVALKWFVMEDDSAVARCLRDAFLAGRCSLAAPNLILYEVAHVLLCKKGRPAAEVDDAVAQLCRAHIVVPFPDQAQISWAVRIAASAQTSVYDATYLALAGCLGWTLITADARFARRTESLGNVCLLDALPPGVV